MRFTWHTGQQPLDGYIIKRGVGRGGFGEVYFAVSESGKEVALKLIQEHEEIETRGVLQCLNLKHPNLVHLYDFRMDRKGGNWVIMEYVVGESLSDVIGRHPHGLPKDLIHEWFPALAKGVAYLHDQGIVHRDLKPGNVFIENGLLKIGDYGLSKSMSGSQGQGQTQSIGTAHYMAPELATGEYDKSVDVYACGVILYEMLTGHVPFDGENAVQVILKHRFDPPDLSEIPEEYVEIVKRGLCKNPEQRYRNVTEIVQDLEKVLEAPKPEPAPVPAPTKAIPKTPVVAAPRKPAPVAQPPRTELESQNRSTTDLLGELAGSMALATLLAVVSTAIWVGLSSMDLHRIQTAEGWGQVWDKLRAIFFLSVSASWAILIPTKFWTKTAEESWGRRLALLGCGILVGAHSLWLSGWNLPHLMTETPTGSALEAHTESYTSTFSETDLPGFVTALASVSYFAIIFLALRWWKVTERTRAQRFSFAPVLGTAFWAVILLLIWQHHQTQAVALVMASAIVQVVSPWEKPRPRPVRRLRLRYV